MSRIIRLRLPRARDGGAEAEVYAERQIAEFGEPDFAHAPLLTRVGSWCDLPLGEPM
ncbi:hypothetical protein [Actinoplanes auranticolor]|uniref:Uncharacterized protein n=1 Tax=Actinoplanes auranticolor TaxID=47988 RepID=A0A919SCR6_9ACTN|nr:hypothetical protein [Actinoplanes auranticolor]GIM68630.1 hypothetical protein Aau02nite_32560 [Actinoplanes auranticolor]